jgi:hypothetical protein
MIPSGESRGGTPSSVRAPKGRAPHRKMRRCYPAFAGVPLPSFYFVARMERSVIRERWTSETAAPDCAALHPGYETRNGSKKDRPTPALSFDRTGFAIDVTIFLQACDPFAIMRTTERGRKNAPRDGRVWP